MVNISTELAESGGTIHLNKSINTVLGKKIDVVGGLQPDILKINDDGSVYMVEVVSPSQKAGDIKIKLDNMITSLEQNGYKASGKVVTETGEEVR